MYRLVFNGKDNQTLTIAGLLVPANTPVYVTDLPISRRQLKAIGVLVDTVDAVPETTEEADAVKAKVTGKVGVKWVGAAPIRRVEHKNTVECFERNKTRWDLSTDAIDAIAAKSGFVKVSGD
jgi:hypothetical protein